VQSILTSILLVGRKCKRHEAILQSFRRTNWWLAPLKITWPRHFQQKSGSDRRSKNKARNTKGRRKDKRLAENQCPECDQVATNASSKCRVTFQDTGSLFLGRGIIRRSSSVWVWASFISPFLWGILGMPSLMTDMSPSFSPAKSRKY
jgi:hypothetical protein